MLKGSDLKDKALDLFYSVRYDKKKLGIIVVSLIFILLFVKGCSSSISSKSNDKYKPDYSSILEGIDVNQSQASGDAQGVEEGNKLYNQVLVDKQPDLISKYGNLPEGFIWDYDGTVISLGNKDLTAEETMYSFLNGIRTLDFSSAQRYSRNSFVVERYNNFYNVSESKSSSYEENFYRNMYTLVLMSMQTHRVTNTATFANEKQVFTVELEIIDLSDKDFWKDDEYTIYKNLYIYEQDEVDDSKSEQYIYDYILNHYKEDDVKKKVITVNLSVEKDATLDTGWLVTIDKDIDNYCYYKDGVSVNKYIMYQYRNVGREQIREEMRGQKEGN